MIEKLPPRERQVFDAVCTLGKATAAQIAQALPDPPSNSAIRAMLSRLERKGFLRHKLVEQTYVYAAAVPSTRLRKSALRQLVKTFFNNSPVTAASALLGMEAQIDPEALDELERLIDKARREQSQ